MKRKPPGPSTLPPRPSVIYPVVEPVDPDDREWRDGPMRLCDPEPRRIRGRCLHRNVVPVESIVTGETLARLCLVCDRQLSA